MTPGQRELVDEIEMLFEKKGREAYGEQVTMSDHSLLTAQTAEREGASDTLIAACLMHDIGHLLVAPDDAYGKHSHDEIGGRWLAERFPPGVSEPVRLHIDAKRYLCGVDPDYYERLSSASQYTLGKQGGPMPPEEQAAFTATAFHEDAVQLRQWEDGFAKRHHANVPPFDRYRPLLERVASQ